MRLPLLFRPAAKEAHSSASVGTPRATGAGGDLRAEIGRQTLRHLAKLGLVGQADANEFYGNWANDAALANSDFLEAFLQKIGYGENDMDVVAARLTTVIAGIAVCDFSDKLASTKSHARLQDALDVLAAHHCKLLHVYEQGALRSLVIGTFNPVCGAVVSGYLRRVANEGGVRPYCCAMRMCYAEWREFKRRLQ
jgi:hypothetical protein